MFPAAFIFGSRDFTQHLTSGELILIHSADVCILVQIARVRAAKNPFEPPQVYNNIVTSNLISTLISTSNFNILHCLGLSDMISAKQHADIFVLYITMQLFHATFSLQNIADLDARQSRWENLDHGQYPFQPITFVNWQFPVLVRQSHIIIFNNIFQHTSHCLGLSDMISANQHADIFV